MMRYLAILVISLICSCEVREIKPTKYMDSHSGIMEIEWDCRDFVDVYSDGYYTEYFDRVLIHYAYKYLPPDTIFSDTLILPIYPLKYKGYKLTYTEILGGISKYTYVKKNIIYFSNLILFKNHMIKLSFREEL